MGGELKNPLLNKKSIIPIIGPIPNISNTSFAEFFVWPNSSLSFLITFFLFFLILLIIFTFYIKII